MANAEEPENIGGRRVFINCVDSYQGKNIAKVRYINLVFKVRFVLCCTMRAVPVVVA